MLLVLVGVGASSCTHHATVERKLVVHPGVGCEPGGSLHARHHYMRKLTVLATTRPGRSTHVLVTPHLADARARMTSVAVALVKRGHNADRYPLARPHVIAEVRASNLTSANVHPLVLHVPATLRPGWYPVIDLVQGSPEVAPCRGGRTTISGQLGTVVVRQLRQ